MIVYTKLFVCDGCPMLNIEPSNHDLRTCTCGNPIRERNVVGCKGTIPEFTSANCCVSSIVFDNGTIKNARTQCLQIEREDDYLKNMSLMDDAINKKLKKVLCAMVDEIDRKIMSSTEVKS